MIENIQTKEELVNELIFLVDRKNEIWSYHPSNPKMVDVILETKKLEFEIKQIKEKLDFLE